jgi:hypothetical protein
MRDLIEQLQELSDKFNANQLDFFRYCREVFAEIDLSKLSDESSVSILNGVLVITLIHKVDIETSIIFRVDKYEIYIISAGMGDSMFYQFPDLRDGEFFKGVMEYTRSVLNANFSKELYTNGSGEYVRAVLKWNNGEFKEISFESFFHRLKSLFVKDHLIKHQYYYSSFLKD